MEPKFYVCKRCCNVITKVKDSGVNVVCCGEVMSEVKVNTVDASVEKHTPVYTREGNKVSVVVGSVIHPMVEEHYIEWVILQTNKGNQRKLLKPGNEPKVIFYLEDDEVVEAVYESCNIHGIWKV